MTTESRPLAPAPRRPSVHVLRARKLLLGGLVGGLGATLICLVAFGIVYGSRGLASAGLGAGLVLVFYAIGQYVMVLFADVPARLLLIIAVLSYTLRIAMLGLVLLSYSTNRAAWPSLVPNVVFVSTIAAVVGWLTAEVWVFSRLRVGVYDTPYEPPSDSDSTP